MEDKKERFNPSKYASEYIRTHYKRKEVKLKPQEAELLAQVLEAKKEDFKAYTMENVKRDIETIKRAKN